MTILHYITPHNATYTYQLHRLALKLTRPSSFRHGGKGRDARGRGNLSRDPSRHLPGLESGARASGSADTQEGGNFDLPQAVCE